MLIKKRAKVQLEINGLVERLLYTSTLNIRLHGFIENNIGFVYIVMKR